MESPAVFQLPSHAILFSGLVFLTVCFPPRIHACAVCFSNTEESLMAYYFTTVLLTFLPIAMILSLGIWLVRRNRKTR